MKALTIGQVAERAGVGVETIRFYEREGLIEDPDRKPSGYRQYPPETIRRIRFIRRAKELGFSLKEISDLLSLRVDPGRTCADVRQHARDKIADIEERMAGLAQMKSALERLAGKCCGSGPTDDCPILAEIDGEGDL